jgi:HK97 family phage major capsid protein
VCSSAESTPGYGTHYDPFKRSRVIHTRVRWTGYKSPLAGRAPRGDRKLNPYQAAQARLNELHTQRDALLADGSTATGEEMDACFTALREAESNLSRIQSLMDTQRAAPAAGAPGVSTYPAVVTPRAEQDPKRGFRNAGHFALCTKAYQDSRMGMPMDSRTAELMGIVLSDTQRFAREEQAERERLAAAGYHLAAPTPLHQEGHSTDGLMVPVDFRNEIWRPAYESDDLLQLFNPQPTSSRVVQFAADETTPWGAQGIVAYWTAEGAQKKASKLSLSPREVHIHKIAALVFTTDELLQDTTLLNARINEAAPQAIAWETVEAFLRGDGKGKPLGYEKSPAKIVIAAEASQDPATIYTENVLKMSARALDGPGSRRLWLAHRSTIPQLATLKIGSEPSWTNQNQGLREAPNGMLLGDAVKFSQHAYPLGTAGDLTSIDFAGYAAFIHSSGTRFDASIHLYFDYDITAFRWVSRVGGMPYLSAAVTPAYGSDTMGHYIQLATRT